MKANLKDELDKAKRFKVGGESEKHGKFKEFIAKNPAILGLAENVGKGQIEYALPSADTIDILFTDTEQKVGVEVKSIISDADDILRGIFQCVKYKYLIEAEQTVTDHLPNSRVLLALQGKMPKQLTLIKNLLCIEIVEDIKNSR